MRLLWEAASGNHGWDYRWLQGKQKSRIVR
jgi:hypothetical protein